MPELTTDRATLQAQLDEALAQLPEKQHTFVLAVLSGKNQTEAAIAAGYSERTARSQASRLLTFVNIQRAIELARQLAARDAVMDANEVLARLTDVARGSLADFLHVERREVPAPPPQPRDDDDDDQVDEAPPAGPRTVLDVRVDLGQAKDRGKLHLLKRFKEGKWGPEIELYDPLRALELLARHHGLLVDRTELTGKDGAPIEVSDARGRLLDRLARRAPDADDRGSDGGAGGPG